MSNVPGAGPVRNEHAFDVGSLERFLAAKVESFGAGTTIAELLQFKGGQSNPTFYIKDSRGNEFVLRKKPPGKLLPSAHAVEREYQVINALSKTKVPVPKALVLCEDSSVIGTPFYVMQYLRGRIFKLPLLPDVPAAERFQIYKEMNRVMAALHNVDYKSIGLENFGNAGNYYARQISRWARQYDSSKTKDIPAMDKVIDWLPKNIPVGDDVSIVHGDLRLDNMIFHPTEPKVIGILDWELSTLGHPLADLAYNCMPYYFPPLPPQAGPFSGFGNIDFKAHGIPTLREFVAMYCDNRKIPQIRSLTFYVAFSIFRAAAILQGVYKRALQGNASSDNAKQVGGFAEFLANKAWDLIQTSQSQRSLFHISDKAANYKQKLLEFMDTHVYPVEAEIDAYAKEHKWKVIPIVEELKKKARAAGLWNLFLPGEHGAGLTNLDYAPLCEIMGRSLIAPEIFNCNAPDTGNMEVLEKYGTPAQQRQWLKPLLNGEIRSAFAMTEPDTASSDATNISTSIVRDGDSYVINGRKWWTTGAGHPMCKILVVMGKTDTKAQVHRQQSMILVPMETPGIRLVRPLETFGYDDAPYGHVELEFKDVRVPASNILVGEGKGFEIAQGRLGPGRIHHCMRLIGLSERCLELMVKRIHSRTTFKKKIAEHGTMMHMVAMSRIEIEQARLLTLQAAYAMDTVGIRVARDLIAMIKVAAPQMACRVIDRAIQAHGAGGMSDDFILARAYVGARALRIADGPDEVHELTIAKIEYSKHLRAKM